MEHIKPRQYGGEGGDGWEDMFRTIKRFVVRHGLWIDSIQIQYEDDNGNLVWSRQHGGDGGSKSEVKPNLLTLIGTFKLFFLLDKFKKNLIERRSHGVEMQLQVVFESPDEYLVSIHGYYSDIHKWGLAATVIRSLTLETNKKTYGPFGVEDGSKFSFPTVGLKVVGIHGRSGWYLDAIGIHVDSIQE